jgi:hypothetical protein
METGTYDSFNNIKEGKGTWQDYVGMAMMVAPVGKGKRDLENEISKKADDAEAKKTDEETTKKATNQEGDAPKKEGDFEAFETTKLKQIDGDPPIKTQKLEAGTPEHKAARWEEYLENGGKWSQERWSKQYDTNMKNVKHGLAQEQAYRDKLGGKSETIKTPHTNRQIDISKPEEMYAGQLKTGKVSLTKQAKIDIKKDATLVEKGYKVEYILEKGASKPFLDALDANGIDYHIGSKIP